MAATAPLKEGTCVMADIAIQIEALLAVPPAAGRQSPDRAAIATAIHPLDPRLPMMPTIRI